MKRSQDRWPWNPDAEPRRRLQEEMQRVAFALTEHKARQRPFGIAFTAPVPGSGSTTVAIGVARELQRSSGMRCVTIEMNRFRPCFAARFGLDNSRAVTALLAREMTLPQCVQKDSHGLQVVPAGGDWSASQAARIACQAMQDAESEFDIVLFDAPACSESADAMAIASVAKEMIVVAAAGRASMESLDRLKLQAAANGAKILGSVLTMRDRFAPPWLFGRGGAR